MTPTCRPRPRARVVPTRTLPTDVVRLTTEHPRCPRPECRGAVLTNMVPGIMSFISSRGWRCPRCGTTWPDA